MTTIDLTPEQEEVLRRWQGADPSRLTDELRVIAQLADRLPAPPYVPAVGDMIRVYSGDVQHTAQPEQTIAVTDTHVIARWNTDTDETLRPEVYAYAINAHRFEKVEQ
jgi:hypothetical protein